MICVQILARLSDLVELLALRWLSLVIRTTMSLVSGAVFFVRFYINKFLRDIIQSGMTFGKWIYFENNIRSNNRLIRDFQL